MEKRNQAILKSLYLKKIEERGTPPNFFCSSAYLSQEHIQMNVSHFYIWPVDEDGEALLPPLFTSVLPGHMDDLAYGIGSPSGCLVPPDAGEVMVDLSGEHPPTGYSREFFDYEFIYRPENFLKMEGGAWEVFRKNSKKYPKRNPGVYEYTENPPEQSKIASLLAEWLENKMGADVYDIDFLISCVLDPPGGMFRMFLKRGGELVAINVYDENWMYVNFRYCISKTKDHADEFARLMFYTDPIILNKQKYVNDGGSLGNQNLFNYKKKLNPVKINERFSWKKIQK